MNEEGWWNGQEDNGGHYGHQVNDAVDVFNIRQSVGGAIKPQQILNDEGGNDQYLQPPEQVFQVAWQAVSIHHKDGYEQKVEKDDRQVYRFSQRRPKIDHVELHNLSEGPGSLILGFPWYFPW
jgi:hypothetical protein